MTTPYLTFNTGFYLGNLYAADAAEFATSAERLLASYGHDVSTAGTVVAGTFGASNQPLLLTLRADAVGDTNFPSNTDDMLGFVFHDSTSGLLQIYANDAVGPLVGGIEAYTGVDGASKNAYVITGVTAEFTLHKVILAYLPQEVATLADAGTLLSELYFVPPGFIALASVYRLSEAAGISNVLFAYTDSPVYVTNSDNTNNYPDLSLEVITHSYNQKNYYKLIVNKAVIDPAPKVELVEESYVPGYILRNVEVTIDDLTQHGDIVNSITSVVSAAIGSYRPGYNTAFANLWVTVDQDPTVGYIYSTYFNVSNNSGAAEATLAIGTVKLLSTQFQVYDPRYKKPYVVTDFATNQSRFNETSLTVEYYPPDGYTVSINNESTLPYDPFTEHEFIPTCANNVVVMVQPNTILNLPSLDPIAVENGETFFFRRLAFDSWLRLHASDQSIVQDVRSGNYYKHSASKSGVITLTVINTANKLAEALRDGYIQEDMADTYNGSNYLSSKSLLTSILVTDQTGYQDITGLGSSPTLDSGGDNGFIIPSDSGWKYDASSVDETGRTATFIYYDKGVRVSHVFLFRRSGEASADHVTIAFNTYDGTTRETIGTTNPVNGVYELNSDNNVNFTQTPPEPSGLSFDASTGVVTVSREGFYRVSGTLLPLYDPPDPNSLTNNSSTPFFILRHTRAGTDTDTGFPLPTTVINTDSTSVVAILRSSTLTFDVSIELQENDELRLCYYRASLPESIQPSLGYVLTNDFDAGETMTLNCNWSVVRLSG